MPSFLGFRETEELWRRLPGRERLDEGDRRVALTFDDGPDPDATPAVLDALEAAAVTATFFLVGEQVMEHRALARELAERGHEVGLHGFSHRPRDELSAREARDELARGLGTLEAATGRRPTLFRPPYGKSSDDTHAACADLGLEVVYWSSWGMDWEPLPAERIVDLATRDLEAGQILVLHDSARYAPREDASATAEAVGPIVSAARAAGLEVGAVSG